jgi:serine phosphatase RsbU (regulator of sigma subunit)
MATILLVDDDKNILFLLSEALKKYGYDLTLVNGGEKALEILKENEFDLVVSDLQMPKVSGIDILSVVKEKYTDTEVLLVTGYGSIKTAVKAMKLGAFDYLSKPVDVEELRHKVNQALNQKELKIQLAEQQKALNEYHEMIQRDMKLAEQIHQSLIPQINKDDKFDIGVKYLPMIGLGGDFADVYYDGEKYIYITLIDVTGHGISAALLVNRICSEVRKLVRENLHPARILHDLNNFIMDVFDHTGMFLTTFTTRINTENYKFSYAGSAHPALILWENNKNRFVKLSSQNVIIGFERKEENEFVQNEIQLNTGDKLFLYTDGIVEAENEQNNALGIKGFVNIINQLKSLPAKEIVERIIEDVQQQYYTQVRDDIFLIAVDVN